MNYLEFIEKKIISTPVGGIEININDIHPILKPHQKDTVYWAVTGGQRAGFLAFGLGKTLIQLEICRIFQMKLGGNTLIIAPLGVIQEFRRDAKMLGIDKVQYIKSSEGLESYGTSYFITNYERVLNGDIDVSKFTVTSLDEAAVLRSYGSETYQTFLPLFEQVKYKFVFTATPAPNRLKELIHYAGFLGIMDTGQALAQPLDSNILTPNGWVKMGDIKVGDFVISQNGKPTKVLGVYPQGEKDIYKITFDDGSFTECTEEHLWLTQTQYQRNAYSKYIKRNGIDGKRDSEYFTIKTTDEIKNTLKCESTNSRNHSIPMVEGVKFNETPILLDAWLLGFLLGDGHLRKTSVNFTTADDFLVEKVSDVAKMYDCVVNKKNHIRKDGFPNYDYSITLNKLYSGGGRGKEKNPILKHFREYGLLEKRSYEKFIPTEYLINSIEIRLEVLRGLMDSDGTIASDGTGTNFTTTSEKLRDDVKFIVESLGGTVFIQSVIGQTPSKGIGRVQYKVGINLPNKYNCFSLPRKSERVIVKEKYTPKRYVDNVELVGVKESQCIAVEDDSHLYVTDNFIVTHNTRFFSRNSQKANELTLYPHKEEEFWLWCHSWGLFVQKPSDLGYSDEGYALPDIKIVEHCIRVPKEGFKTDSWGNIEMFDKQAVGLADASKEKRESITVRLEKAIEIIEQSDDKTHWLLWHHLENERKAIEAMLPEAKTVFGTQDIELRENLILDFSDGNYRILATKPEIAGSGCNFQRHCHKAIFMGINYSFHDIIQAIHRIYRFLQTEQVEIHFIFTENEQNIWKSFMGKWQQHKEVTANMSELIQKYGLSDAGVDRLKRNIGIPRIEAKGKNYIVVQNDAVEEARITPTGSQQLIVTSIPFANHYEYSPNYNDFGHTNNNNHFWAQMDFLTPELLRILEPGRVAAIHVKDRINFGNVTGYGFPTVQPFHSETIQHYIKHGFRYCGMITVTTDVVRENNQTYRLGWTEQSKDGSKMAVGSPEYVLLFRKEPTDTSNGYADNPVVKDKEQYTRKQWQIDAHALYRSSGNRLITPEELATMDMDYIQKWWKNYKNENVYDYETHVNLGLELEKNGRLPATFMLFDPAINTEWVWSDILRMRTLNSEQTKRKEENHICPLQLDIIERLINRFTNEGESVYDPFGGIMSVPYCALNMNRKAKASELNPDYWRMGKQYCYEVEYKKSVPTLFDVFEVA